MNNKYDEKYVYEMRKAFSHHHMILPNGELNHKYFLQKIGKYWSDEKTESLYKGIEKYGVGNWKDIQTHFLPGWGFTYIELHTKLLFHTSNIAPYIGSKYSQKEIEEIASNNHI